MPKLVGTEPYQVPRNADLGTMAYQDADFLSINSMLATGNVASSGNVFTANLAINSTTSNVRFKSVGDFSIETGSNNTKLYNSGYNFVFDNGPLNYTNASGISLITSSNAATPVITLISNNAGTVATTKLFATEPSTTQHEFNIQVNGYNGLKILKSENRDASVFMSPITEGIGAKLVVRNRWDGAPGLRLSRLANTTTADIMQVTDETQNIRFMTIANTGNVGISTTTPNANLHVVGTTIISGQANVGIIKTAVYTVATLPAAGTAGAGARAYVSDSLTNTYLSIATGGGANGVLVFSNGTNWLLG